MCLKLDVIIAAYEIKVKQFKDNIIYVKWPKYAYFGKLGKCGAVPCSADRVGSISLLI